MIEENFQRWLGAPESSAPFDFQQNLRLGLRNGFHPEEPGAVGSVYFTPSSHGRSKRYAPGKTGNTVVSEGGRGGIQIQSHYRVRGVRGEGNDFETYGLQLGWMGDIACERGSYTCSTRLKGSGGAREGVTVDIANARSTKPGIAARGKEVPKGNH